MLIKLSNMAKGVSVCTVIALIAAWCVSTPIPNEQIAVAKSSVQRAEQNGAPELAPVEMSTARQELASAEKAAANREALPATQWAEKANVDAQLAEASLIDWRRPYRDALVTEWLPTRLGDGTVTVAPKNLVSPFTRERIAALPIPGRWLRGMTPPEEPVDAVDGQIQIGSQFFHYGRLGLVRTKAASW